MAASESDAPVYNFSAQVSHRALTLPISGRRNVTSPEVYLSRPRRGAILPANRVEVPSTDTYGSIQYVLSSVFGDGAPLPYFISDNGGTFVVIGYTTLHRESLLDIAVPRMEMARADLHFFDTVDLESLTTTPAALVYSPGTELDFRVRVCPIARIGSKEVDAFDVGTFEREHRGLPRDEKRDSIRAARSLAYRRWVSDRFASDDAAELVDCVMDDFILDEFRSDGHMRRPVAALRGRIVVRNSVAFEALLRRGIGRHRKRGFGFLRLEQVPS